MSNRVSFRVPASAANLGAGFDALSLALDRYLRVSIEPADALRIEAHGVDHGLIPTGSQNLVYRVAEHVASKRGRPLPPVHMILENEIPLARGMGSSAAAIIAGITCYELLCDDRLLKRDLFHFNNLSSQ